jgi:hypothetical protein
MPTQFSQCTNFGTLKTIRGDGHVCHGGYSLELGTSLLRRGTQGARRRIASRLGSLCQSALVNYMVGIHAYEAINGYEPVTLKAAVVPLLRAANTVATMKNEPRLPIRITLIKQFYALLDVTSRFDTARFACTTTAF